MLWSSRRSMTPSFPSKEIASYLRCTFWRSVDGKLSLLRMVNAGDVDLRCLLCCCGVLLMGHGFIECYLHNHILSSFLAHLDAMAALIGHVVLYSMCLCSPFFDSIPRFLPFALSIMRCLMDLSSEFVERDQAILPSACWCDLSAQRQHHSPPHNAVVTRSG